MTKRKKNKTKENKRAKEEKKNTYIYIYINQYLPPARKAKDNDQSSGIGLFLKVVRSHDWPFVGKKSTRKEVN